MTDRTTGVAIELDGVSKSYPGQAAPAVERLDLTIGAGEIVAFVGPSGCGKTTTLKMINRLIEPSSGRILIDGRNALEANADELRRSIGYVIQSGGLFPHWTTEKNIGAVPRMLGWDAKRIEARTEELLDLVGLDPKDFRKRFPKDMSGGQQQRVGVARALAADPPVLLMDEPFGAVDPITRVRLQDSLLDIHEELGKTIAIVTHDIEEAIKLGDRVLILSEGGHVEQYATPDEILSAPATPFVEEFVGSGATLRHLSLSTVSELTPQSVVEVRPGDSSSEVLERARAAGRSWVVVVDRAGRPQAWPTLKEVASGPTVTDFVDRRLPTVQSSATLADALDIMLAASQGGVLVLDRTRLVGSITIEAVMERIRDVQAQAHPDLAADTYAASQHGGAAAVDEPGDVG
ncbi:ABC transporter ATP-binding protein [Tsukamurella sp. 8F]|uniref:ABC transporter ATP-binding protein n=1 Tax=unclassified Tsukamurella TaxID=2633480 RepID=UPI0023B89805|nr:MULTISPECIES: ABC transporter ATP-binding protein [unclassified Tsukamurella]MDF0530358.1 ABC transporter ATP-binding protein [Tsukamurella sp. 8J]MDF0587655.1 ABC transporter ATP-binding protein [Tsukamurella sp. 8F]